MNKRLECNGCAFYKRDGFQDMGAHADVCKANPNIWDGIIDGESKVHCPYAVNIKQALKKARETWKRDLENPNK